MNAKSAIVFTALLVLVFLGWGWAGDRGIEPVRAVPDEAFKAIVQECTQSIRGALQKGEARSTYLAVRVNALVIALAADHRLARKNDDSLAGDLRDAALNLVEGLELHYHGQQWGLRHAAPNATDHRAILAELAKRLAALERSTEPKPGPRPQPARIRLSSRFDHHDVTFFFGGCGGHSGHKIESELLKLTEVSLEPEKLAPIERMACKVALAAELLRDFDTHADLFKGEIPDRRKLWVGLSMDLEQAAWELADSARSKQVDKTRAGVHKLNNACIACHLKAGFRHSN